MSVGRFFKSIVWLRVLPSLCRVIVGCVFLMSSLPKIRHPYDFLSNVYGFELVSPPLGQLVAMVLPWVELILGICLLGGIFMGGALLMSILLAILFTIVQASAIQRGLDISCGCFSASDIATGSSLISYATLIRTSLLLILCVAGYCCLMFRPATAKESASR